MFHPARFYRRGSALRLRVFVLALICAIVSAPSIFAGGYKILVCSTRGFGAYYQHGYYVTPRFTVEGDIPDGIYSFVGSTMIRDSGNWTSWSVSVEIKDNQVLSDSPNTTLRPEGIGAPGPGNFGYGWTMTRKIDSQLYAGTTPIPESKVTAEPQRFIEWDLGDIPDDQFWPLWSNGPPPIPLIWKVTIKAKDCPTCRTSCPAGGASNTESGASVGPSSAGWSPAASGGNILAASGLTANYGTGSGLEVTAGLGVVANGNSAGSISLQTAELAPGLVTRGSLLVTSNAGVEVIKDGSSVVRQFLSSSLLTDVVQVNANKLEIRQYAAGDKGAKDGSGYYVPTGPAIRTTVIENPVIGGQPDTSKLTVTEVGGENSVTAFSYDASTSNWSASTDNGARQEFVTKQWNGDRSERTETYQIKNGQNVVVYEEQNIYRAYPWGEEKISRILGPSLPTNSQQRWTWDYYSDSSQTGKYARLKTAIDPSGFWEAYDYDSSGREVKKVAQFLDAPVGSPEANCRVVTTAYSDANPHKTVVEILQGFEIRREYDAVINATTTNHIRATVAGAAWSDASNLVTSTEIIASGPFFGQTRKVRNADGTMTLYDYVMDGQNKVTTVSTGQASADGNTVVAGTATVSTVNPAGSTISETVTDISSGLILSWSNATTTDAAGRPTLVQYLGGTTETFSYGCCGVDFKTDKEGIWTYYTYDAERRVLTESRSGITFIYKYDAAGRKTSTTRRGSDSTEILLEATVYDISGRVISVITPRGTASFDEVIDASGHLVKTTALPDAGIKVETFAQDHSLLEIAGSGAHPTRYEYGVDASGVFTKEIRLGPLGESTEWSKRYTDLAGRESKIVFPDGAHAQKFYNGQGQLIKDVDPDGVTRLYSYNGKGEQEFNAVDINRNGIIDADGPDQVTRTTSEVATAHGLSVSRRTTIKLSETGPITVSMIENGVDGLQSWETRYGLTTHRSIDYNGSGARTETVMASDASYVVNEFESGRLTSMVSFDNTGTQIRGTTYFYDGHGRLSRQNDARNGSTSFIYDAGDQVRMRKSPPASSGMASQITGYDHDGQGRVIQIALPGNTTVHYEYFSTGELKKQYGAQTYPVEYTYDTQGRMRTLHAGTGTTTWTYDPQRGWLSAKLYDDGNGPSYTYTLAGRLQTRLWVRGVTTTYGYDNAGELSGITYSDSTPAVAYIRDRQNRITNITDAAGNHVLTYGPADQPGADTITGGLLDSVAVINGYDAFQRRNTLEYKQNGSSVVSQTYGYDGISRLASAGNGTVSATYGYLPNSDLIGTVLFENGGTPVMRTTKSYDKLNRLTSTSTARTSGTVLSSFAYDYNALNQRTQAKLHDGTYWRYSYDGLGQVSSGEKHWNDGSAVGGQQFGYAFDDIGNRASTQTNGRTATFTVNTLNQYSSRSVPGAIDIVGAADADSKVTVNNKSVTRRGDHYFTTLNVDNSSGPLSQAIDVVAIKHNAGPSGEDAVDTRSGAVLLPKTPELPVYDLDGNLTQDGLWTYAWDGENRLASMWSNTNVPPTLKKRVSFDYDHRHRRIQKRVYAWNMLLNAFESSPSATIKFVNDGWNILAEINSDNFPIRKYLWGLDYSGTLDRSAGVGGLLAETTVNNATTYFPCFDAIGNTSALVTMSGAADSVYEYGPFGEPIKTLGPQAAENPIRFSTKYQDTDTSLLYYGNRYYQPATGRWINRDPIDESGGLNVYGFVGNDSVNKIDYAGLFQLKVDTAHPHTGECGAIDVESFFIISPGSKMGGYVVQTVTQSNRIGRCGNTKLPKAETSVKQEAFQVYRQKGHSIADTRSERPDHFPLVTIPKLGCDWGEIVFEATAVFYEGGVLPPEFKENRKTGSGVLPSVPGSKYRLPSQFDAESWSDTLHRKVRVWWNCCPTSKDRQTHYENML
jgi:RHS repeat-associated protein